MPSAQLDDFSSYRYEPGAGPVAACDKPIKGMSPRPYLYGESLLLPFRGNKELAITTNDSVRVAVSHLARYGEGGRAYSRYDQ